MDFARPDPFSKPGDQFSVRLLDGYPDRLPRKTLILGALLFWSVATGATAFSRSYWQLVLCRALGGLGGVAPIAIAVAAAPYGMSAAISATAGIYLIIGLLMLWEATGPERNRENSRIGAQ